MAGAINTTGGGASTLPQGGVTLNGGTLTGTATNDMGSSEIKEGSIKSDNVFFVENLEFDGRAIRIEYTGKISGDEIQFTRKVADFATEDFVAHRCK